VSVCHLPLRPNSTDDTGGPVEQIADQFLHELNKRELGRQQCLAAECTHFMSMDADEFYIESELRAAMAAIQQHGYEATACRMRTYFKQPIYEMFPPENVNAVPLIFPLHRELAFKVCCHRSSHQSITPAHSISIIELLWCRCACHLDRTC
jgi:hypothetical protein